jgi:hypothetical protein
MIALWWSRTDASKSISRHPREFHHSAFGIGRNSGIGLVPVTGDAVGGCCGLGHALAAGTDRLPRASHSDQPVTHCAGHDPAPFLGGQKGLSASVTDYIARTPQRQALRFSRTGDPAVEE